MKLSSYCFQGWRWSYFIEVMLYWFLPKLFPFLIFFLYEVLALQHCLQFSMNLDETFQLLFPWPEEAHIIPRCTWLLFLQDLWPLVSFSHVANRNYYQYLCNSSYSVQGILMKLSRYCSRDLKVIISRRQAKLKMTQLFPLMCTNSN